MENDALIDTYNKLPEDVRSAIVSVDSARAIQDIGKKYALHIDQTGELYDETGLVMMGVDSTQEFIPKIQSRLGVNKEIAAQIASDINNEIFLKIRESMQKIQEEKQKEAQITTSTQQSEKPKDVEGISFGVRTATTQAQEDLVKWIENPELITLSPDLPPKMVEEQNPEQARILHDIENPPDTPTTTSASQKSESLKVESGVGKGESREGVVESPKSKVQSEATVEAGGPAGEGILPAVSPVELPAVSQKSESLKVESEEGKGEREKEKGEDKTETKIKITVAPAAVVVPPPSPVETKIDTAPTPPAEQVVEKPEPVAATQPEVLQTPALQAFVSAAPATNSPLAGPASSPQAMPAGIVEQKTNGLFRMPPATQQTPKKSADPYREPISGER